MCGRLPLKRQCNISLFPGQSCATKWYLGVITRFGEAKFAWFVRPLNMCKCVCKMKHVPSECERAYPGRVNYEKENLAFFRNKTISLLGWPNGTSLKRVCLKKTKGTCSDTKKRRVKFMGRFWKSLDKEASIKHSCANHISTWEDRVTAHVGRRPR